MMEAPAFRWGDVISGLLGVPVPVVIGDDHLCFLFYEGVSNRRAKTAVPAGNQGHPPGELQAWSGTL